MEKNLKTRIQNKHDIEANWIKATNFIPKIGELIVYDVDENFDYVRVKIGDGVKNINELPFIDEHLQEPVQSDWNEIEQTSLAYIKNKPEIATDEEIIDMLAEEDMLPAVADTDGSILTDESENVLLW